MVATVCSMKLRITGQTPAVSEPLRAYADLKIGKPLARYAEMLRTDVELNLKVESRSRHDTEHLGKEAHIAEVTAYCKDKHVIHCAVTCDNMYASLDELTDTLGRKLRKYKERKTDTKQAERRESKLDLSESLIDEEDEDEEPSPPPAAAAAVANGASSPAGVDPIALVRRKAFPMPAITTADAIVCLDYIDHDFYVFRNVDTSEINVVYKRNSGGVGLIEPERD